VPLHPFRTLAVVQTQVSCVLIYANYYTVKKKRAASPILHSYHSANTGFMRKILRNFLHLKKRKDELK